MVTYFFLFLFESDARRRVAPEEVGAHGGVCLSIRLAFQLSERSPYTTHLSGEFEFPSTQAVPFLSHPQYSPNLERKSGRS